MSCDFCVLREMVVGENELVGGGGRERVNHVPGPACPRFFTILGQHRKRVAGKNSVSLTFLLCVVHPAEEGIRLGADVVIDAERLLVFMEGISVMKGQAH